MSGSQDTHHSTEQKPVAFTVPLILASVLVLIIVLFLSLCDPKPHHHGEGGHGDEHNAVGTEATHHHDAAAPADQHEAAAASVEVKKDSANVETAAPEAEHAHGEEGHHH